MIRPQGGSAAMDQDQQPEVDHAGDDDALVDDLSLDPPRRRSLLTRVLVGLLVLAAGFLAGAGVQRSLQDAAGIPIVTGIVQRVSGNVVDVADGSGNIVPVTVPDTAVVSTLGLRELDLGTPVAVTGNRSTDGGIIAVTLTARPRRR